MLEHTKMHHIENKYAVFSSDDEMIPIEEAFELKPSTALRGARGKEEMTQAELSRRTGIPIHYIRDMENDRRPIDEETAIKLGEALNIGYNVFL